MQTDNWTNSEKRVARAVFDAALREELSELMLQFKEKATSARETDHIWEIRDWLNTRQRQIDSEFDFRYSQLLRVFGHLVAKRRISVQALQGLSEQKLQEITRIAEFFRS